MTGYTHDQLITARIQADVAAEEAGDHGDAHHARLWSEAFARILGLPLAPEGGGDGLSTENAGEQVPCARCAMREAVALDRMGNRVCTSCYDDLKDAPLSTWVTRGRS